MKRTNCRKNFLMLLLMLLIAVVFSSAIVPAKASSALIGDIDGDGLISTSDATAVLTEYARLATSHEPKLDKEIADVDGDGLITTNDAILILTYYSKCAAGWENVTWPPKNAFHSGETIIFKGKYWNLRSSPKTDSAENIVSILRYGDEFTITNVLTNNWLEITFHGANSLFVQITDEFAYTKYETTSNTTTTTLTTTNTTTTTTTTTTQVQSTSSTLETSTTTIAKTPKFAENDNLKFIGESWNIRSLPVFQDDNIIGTIYTNDILVINNCYEDDWYLITCNGLHGYCNLKDYWNFEKVTPNDITTGDKLRFNGISWNIRDSINGNPVATLQNGDIFIIGNNYDEWYSIIYKDETGDYVVGFVNIRSNLNLFEKL